MEIVGNDSKIVLEINNGVVEYSVEICEIIASVSKCRFSHFNHFHLPFFKIRYTGRQTDRQAGRHAHTYAHTHTNTHTQAHTADGMQAMLHSRIRPASGNKIQAKLLS